jgi:hypothetical protein
MDTLLKSKPRIGDESKKISKTIDTLKTKTLANKTITDSEKKHTNRLIGLLESLRLEFIDLEKED